jgi:hypothetical protein
VGVLGVAALLGTAVAVPSVTAAAGRAAVLAVSETAHAGRVLAGAVHGDVAGDPAGARSVGSGSAGVVRIDADRARELDHTPDQVLTGPVGTARNGSVPFAYAGDSITARPGSWLRDLATDPAVHAVTGYAHSGYRADQVRALMPTVRGAAVLVVELGTNDVNQAVPAARTLASIDALVARVGAPHVLVVDTPPSDHTTSLWGVDRRTGNAALNRDLAADARRHGWSIVDPFAADRTADGAYVPGTTLDGIHPTTQANTAIALRMARAIVAAARTP